ncbi:MAG: hypothetical protein EAX87_10760 [Candidatus Thorarchaeota archaeon]|nr:hypothetical protein [Candidatus Thorarchaeota archaeon]
MALNNVSREREYVDYNTTLIGIVVTVAVIVVLFSIIINMKFLSQISGPVEHTPVTEIEMHIPDGSLFLVSLAIVSIAIYLLYRRLTRSTLE